MQLVQLPLGSLVVVQAVYLWRRSMRRERVMLGWFIAGLLSMLCRCGLTLLRNGEPPWFLLVHEGVFPTITHACFMVSMYLWWIGRAPKKPGSTP